MDLKRLFSEVKEKRRINTEDLLELSKRFDCRKAVVAVYLTGEGLITVEEAVESLEKENGFFITNH